MKATRALSGALLLALLLPLASAAPASVLLTSTEGAWNGESRVDVGPADAPRAVVVWVPQGARVQAALARAGESAAPAPWQAAGAEALSVLAPAEARAVVVRFDIPDKRPWLARYVAPEGVDTLTLHVAPRAGHAVESPDADFVAEAGGFTARRALAPGDAVAIRVIDEGRIGEIPLFATVAGLAFLVLLGTLVWHRVRPPLEGRPPAKFVDHLRELQARLLPPALVFAALNLFYFTSGLRLASVGGAQVVLPTWGVDASVAARAFDALAERLVPPDVTLVVLRPADAVLAQVGMCLFLALATVLPLAVYEISAFLSPGLAPRERRVALRVLPLVTALFLTGALLAYMVMAPLMVRTLYDYAPGIGATPLLAVGELVSFALLVILALALAFELPVVMYALARLGVVRAATFGKYVRHAILVIVIAAGLITPDPSVVSQLLLAVPIVALYLLGIGAAAMGERRTGAARAEA